MSDNAVRQTHSSLLFAEAKHSYKYSTYINQ